MANTEKQFETFLGTLEWLQAQPPHPGGSLVFEKYEVVRDEHIQKRDAARAYLRHAWDVRQKAQRLVEAPLTTDAEKRVLRFILSEEGNETIQPQVVHCLLCRTMVRREDAVQTSEYYLCSACAEKQAEEGEQDGEE